MTCAKYLLIEYNILHLRSSAHYGFDIDVKKDNDKWLIITGLITANSSCGFNAIKAFVNTGDRKKETREGDRKGATCKGKQETYV